MILTILAVTGGIVAIGLILIMIAVVASSVTLSGSLAKSVRTLEDLQLQIVRKDVRTEITAAIKELKTCVQAEGAQTVEQTFAEELTVLVLVVARYTEALTFDWDTEANKAQGIKLRMNAIAGCIRFRDRVRNLRIGVPVDNTEWHDFLADGTFERPTTGTTTAAAVATPVVVDAAKAIAVVPIAAVPAPAEPATVVHSEVPPDIEALAAEISTLSAGLSDDKLQTLVTELLDTTRYYFGQHLPESITENFVTFLTDIAEVLRLYRDAVARPTSVGADYSNEQLLERVRTSIANYAYYVSQSARTVLDAKLAEMEDRMDRLDSLRSAASILGGSTTNPTV